MRAIIRENLMRDRRIFRRVARSTRRRDMTRSAERWAKWFMRGVARG